MSDSATSEGVHDQSSTAVVGESRSDAKDYAIALGKRLRAIRSQQGMSLAAVEEQSAGRWKAVVIGSYERGDRAITVSRLAELAAFYKVPVDQLLPATEPEPGPVGSLRITLDLERLDELTSEEIGPLARYASAIKSQRGDYNNKVLSLRREDLNTLAIIYDCPAEQLLDRLVTWKVAPSDSADMFD